MKRVVRVTRRGARDADLIYRWLSDRSQSGAKAWSRKYLETLHNLPFIAENAARIPEADEIQRDLREVIFKTRRGNPYRLVFLVDEEVIHVLFVRGWGQDFLSQENLET